LGTAIALQEFEQIDGQGGDIMRAPSKTATIYPWVTDPTGAFLGRTRGRVAEVMAADPIPGRVYLPAQGATTRVRRLPEPMVKYEKRGSLGIITARVENVGEVYDEIDALLDRIEGDREVRHVAIFTLNGLFASLPLR